MKGADEPRKQKVVRTTLEALYILAHFLAPVIPLSAEAIFDKLNTPPVPVFQLTSTFYNLKPGTTVSVGEILFHKIEVEDGSTANVSSSGNKTEKDKSNQKKGVTESTAKPTEKVAKEKGKGGVEQKPKAKKAEDNKPALKEEEVGGTDTQDDFSKIELRVGKIVKVWCHESADR